MMRAVIFGLLVALGSLPLSGCWGDADGVYVVAPFNDRTKLAQIETVWRNTGEERAFADSTRLDEPQVRFQYQVDVENRLEERLYLHLGKLELLDDERLSLGAASEEATCVLDTGKADGLLEGSVWVPKRSAKKVSGFRIERFGVPLSDRGRAMYREWLLQSRPGEEAAIDSELAQFAAAPACR